MKKLLALVVVLMVAGPGWAEDWVEVGKNGDGNIFYLDLDSLDMRYNTGLLLGLADGRPRIPTGFRVWIKMLFKDGYQHKGKPVWYELGLVDLDCQSKTLRSVSTYGYDRKALILYQYEDDYKRTHIPPGSLFNGILVSLCTQTNP